MQATSISISLSHTLSFTLSLAKEEILSATRRPNEH